MSTKCLVRLQEIKLEQALAKAKCVELLYNDIMTNLSQYVKFALAYFDS